MIDTIKFYCAEPGPIHGISKPRPQWIDTFRKLGTFCWQTVPPERTRLGSRTSSEILHRTSEVAITTDGVALRYAYKYVPTGAQKWGGDSPLEVRGREIMKVPIDLRTGREYEAELGTDYWIDHVTYEMRCRCGKSVPARRERLHRILDRLRATGLTDSLSLAQLELALQVAPE